jgi:tRNA threonylcarbamoyladenosine biosynthesis protein TsaE
LNAVPCVRLALISTAEDETERLGRALGRTLPAGCLVALLGDLGAGKTAFVRGLARGLGLDAREISSPTFLYFVEHEGGRLPLVHADLYRLEDLAEDERADLLESIGLAAAVEGEGVAAVEWWQYWSGPLPARCVVVEFSSISGDTRRITLEFSGADLEAAASAVGDFPTAAPDDSKMQA